MEKITEKQGLTLVADLWIDEYPLVKRYFGKYLNQLIKIHIESPYEGHFINAAIYPGQLEERLKEIDHLGQTGSIVSEIGNIKDPVELDRRLMDAWAELRTISQLLKEGFENVSKVTEIADLTATRGDEKFAFQVKHINNSLNNQVNLRNEPSKRDSNPEGEIGDIYARLGIPISYFFWDALEKKNGKFKNWTGTDSKRCIVIVSSDEALQDSMVRRIACKKIQEGIHSLEKLNFEELLWFPDTGNGARFTIGFESNEIRCFVDWSDNPNIPFLERDTKVNRIEMSLE